MTTTLPDNSINPQIAKLELTGVTTVFNSVSGFSVNLDVQAEPIGATAQGDPQYSFRMTGLPSYGDLSCEAKLSKTDTSLFTWWKDLSSGKVEPKNGTLTIMSPTNTPQASFNIVGAILTQLGISDHGLSDPAAATITATLNCLEYERMS